MKWVFCGEYLDTYTCSITAKNEPADPAAAKPDALSVAGALALVGASIEKLDIWRKVMTNFSSFKIEL